MPFDFYSSKRPTSNKKQSSSSDSALAGLDSLPRPPKDNSSASSGFSNKPRMNNNSGYSRPESRPGSRPAEPFSNKPERNRGTDNVSSDSGSYQNNHYRGRQASLQPPHARRFRSKDPSALPWNIILPAIGILVVVILCIVFRKEILSFLSSLLSFVIVIVIILAILRFLIFPRRK